MIIVYAETESDQSKWMRLLSTMNVCISRWMIEQLTLTPNKVRQSWLLIWSDRQFHHGKRPVRQLIVVLFIEPSTVLFTSTHIHIGFVATFRFTSDSETCNVRSQCFVQWHVKHFSHTGLYLHCAERWNVSLWVEMNWSIMLSRVS